MARPAKPCTKPGCPNLQPCAEHTPAPWENSTRRQRTISGSRQQKRARRIIARYDGICHICNHWGADQVDHVIPLAEGGADDDTNLRPIHSRPCHQNKTAAEAARARTGGT